MKYSYLDIKPKYRKSHINLSNSKYFHRIPRSYMDNVLIPRVHTYKVAHRRFIYLGDGIFNVYVTAKKWSYFGIDCCVDMNVVPYKFLEWGAPGIQIEIPGKGNCIFYYPEHTDISNLEEEAIEHYGI